MEGWGYHALHVDNTLASMTLPGYSINQTIVIPGRLAIGERLRVRATYASK
jgi:preprotein translocase subunit SecF